MRSSTQDEVLRSIQDFIAKAPANCSALILQELIDQTGGCLFHSEISTWDQLPYTLTLAQGEKSGHLNIGEITVQGATPLLALQRLMQVCHSAPILTTDVGQIQSSTKAVFTFLKMFHLH